MDAKRFKRKKFSPPHLYPKFPGLKGKEPYIGVYDGHSVSVFDQDAIYDIYAKGNFGKGSLSRSAPFCIVSGDTPPIILQQQWENRLKWSKDNEFQTKPKHSRDNDDKIYADSVQDFLNFALSNYENDSWRKHETSTRECENVETMESCETSLAGNININNENDITNDPLNNMVEEILQSGKIREPKSREKSELILVAENISDLENLDDLKISDIRIKLQHNSQHIKECLKLNLPEAFFLHFAIGCLKVVTIDGHEMNVNDLWNEFCKVDKSFIDKYAIYHHYRANGWTVRSGLKFGGDYLLYKIGPMYFHASYLIWILNRKKENKMNWSEFVALNRLVETCNKDLLLCEVLGPEFQEESSPDIFKEFSLLEFVSKRWIPSQERNQRNPESK